MTFEYGVMILIAIITGAAGWVSNIITNRPKNEEANQNRVNWIVTEYEKSLERSREENICLREEIKELRQKIEELTLKIKELEDNK